MAHYGEPFCDINTVDARTAGIEDGDIAELATSHGKVLLRAHVGDKTPIGSVFASIHWSGKFARQARIDAIVSANTDPHSGQPESKYTPVAVRSFETGWYGFALSLSNIGLSDCDYAALAPCKAGVRLELADHAVPGDWDAFAESLFGGDWRSDDDRLTYRDARAGQYRFAQFRDGLLNAALFVSRRPLTVSRTWAADQLGKEFKPEERLKLLAGRPGADVPDKGAIVLFVLRSRRERDCRSCRLQGMSQRGGGRDLPQGRDKLRLVQS